LLSVGFTAQDQLNLPMELKKLKDQVIVITVPPAGSGWSQRGWQQNGDNTVIHEFRRMSPMEESLFSPDI
jgi:hypothetical protein